MSDIRDGTAFFYAHRYIPTILACVNYMWNIIATILTNTTTTLTTTTTEQIPEPILEQTLRQTPEQTLDLNKKHLPYGSILGSRKACPWHCRSEAEVEVAVITKFGPQPFQHKELCKRRLSLNSTNSRKDCSRHCQSLAAMEDVDSEKQKPLLFHFQTPCLQFWKDEK